MTTTTARRDILAQLDPRDRLDTAAREARGLEGALEAWETLMGLGEWKHAARFWWAVVAPLMAGK